MTPLVRWLRNRAEAWLGRLYEGPSAPKRLREQAIAFANMHPNATRGEWLAFAAGFAEECYEAGYVRGLEWAERDPEPEGGKPSPEEIADEMDPDWLWRPSLVMELPEGDVVPEERDGPAIIRMQAKAVVDEQRRARRF